MEQREAAICQWFDMWLTKRDTGIRGPFRPPDAVYIESWGPEYHGADKIAWWFTEWNRRGTVERWDIRQFFHKGDQTVVEWTFANRMYDGRREVFEGMTLVRWTATGQIARLQEFGCNLGRYDPYAHGPEPRFRGPAGGLVLENPKSGARSFRNGRRCLDTKKGRLIFAAS